MTSYGYEAFPSTTVWFTPEGEVVADMTGKKNGRGAYLCPSESCLRRVQKSKRAEKVLECSVPEEVYESIAKALAAEDEA
ncbi:MAG: YlxR family protein [Clostridia bacterium]|nr:YlxR family protein [Clostridia bacterium]